jgi:hypothetical protein
MQYWGKRSATLGKNLLQKTVISLGFVRCHLLFAGFGASVDRYCVKQYSPLLFIKRIGSLCYAKGVESPSS